MSEIFGRVSLVSYMVSLRFGTSVTTARMVSREWQPLLQLCLICQLHSCCTHGSSVIYIYIYIYIYKSGSDPDKLCSRTRTSLV